MLLWFDPVGPVISCAVRSREMIRNLDGSPVALGSTEPHAVRAKQVNPHQGLTQATESKIFKR